MPSKRRASHRNVLVTFAGLILVLDHVLLLQLPHSLNLVEINNEACVIRVVQLDTLSAKNSKVVRAVEVLDPVWVLLAELIAQGLVFFLVEVETCLRKHWVFLYNFVQNVDV